MEVISHHAIMVFDHEHADIIRSDASGLPLAARPGHEIRSYRELLRKTAALSYHNQRYSILLRGQSVDYRPNMYGESGVHTSLYPSILRPDSGRNRVDLLEGRFRDLGRMEDALQDVLRVKDIRQNQIVRWAILQHYGICPTPLLDVTASIQTALSFALYSDRDEGYIYVLGFPHLSGGVSVSVESMTQVIDLSKLCPPEALRPHFQSGLLVGDYPAVDSRESSHAGKGMIGNNFACRLLTKFRLTGCRSWASEGFTSTPVSILKPDDADEWFKVLTAAKLCSGI